ncbi:hypothetical protein OZX56_05400 [Lactobacillus sp. ESL0684]|uniref:hypothetical protein n=1 Tax=Lactobacillus sp. ESL0684 TaxID=2983213 RepID=UPI0023F70952|nr:hypothetical protein [Lactobacillus sp. ESL0684]WEV42985.1 hypothetical protein OZX56_05400 [Lactobacillus sp. ESL0684]
MQNKKIEAYKGKDGDYYEIVENEGEYYDAVTFNLSKHAIAGMYIGVDTARQDLLDAGAVPVKVSDTLMEM